MRFKKTLLATAALIFSSSVYAIPEWRNGTVENIFADPSDIVMSVNGPVGPCGSPLYHIKRTNVNFSEFYSLSLTAFAAGKSVSIWVVGCEGDRNIISHGSINK